MSDDGRWGPRIDVTVQTLQEARRRGPVSLTVEYVAFKQDALGHVDVNDKFARFADLAAFARSGIGKLFMRNHTGAAIGLVFESRARECVWRERDRAYGAHDIYQKAALVDHGDLLDRAVAGELRFVSVRIGSEIDPTCSICGGAMTADLSRCARLGHVFGQRYQWPGKPRGVTMFAERRWPADAHLIETSWVDGPACADARVVAIRLSSPASSSPRPAASAASHARGELARPTSEQRAALVERVFSDPFLFTTVDVAQPTKGKI